MKIYSDVLTERDLIDACPEGVYLNGRPEAFGGNKRRFTGVTIRSIHRHKRGDGNGGRVGGGASACCATYDEHGEWMARLFEIDSDARIKSAINDFQGREDFHKQTSRRYLVRAS